MPRLVLDARIDITAQMIQPDETRLERRLEEFELARPRVIAGLERRILGLRVLVVGSQFVTAFWTTLLVLDIILLLRLSLILIPIILGLFAAQSVETTQSIRKRIQETREEIRKLQEEHDALVGTERH